MLRLFLLSLCFLNGSLSAYNGIHLGSLETYEHGASGDVYVADGSTFIVDNFKYDGRGPDAFFWVGRNAIPGYDGSIALHSDREEILKRYDGEKVIVKLPNDYKMNEVKSLSVWCRLVKVNFADISFSNIPIPSPQKIDRFPLNSKHGVGSNNLIILDSKTIKVPSFQYDGKAPDAYFMVGKGEPSVSGTKVPFRGQQVAKLNRAYNGEDVILQLPDDLTVADIDYISVYCIQYSENFGHVSIPARLTVPAKY